MGRPKKNATNAETAAETATAGASNGAAGSAAATEAAAEAASVARETADDLRDSSTARAAEARVSRITNGPRPAYICTISPANVNNQFFTENFGGGKYEIKIWVPEKTAKGGSQLVYSATKHIEIDVTIPRKTPPWLQEAPAQIAAAGNGRDPDDDDRDRPRRSSPRATALMDAEVESILEASRRSREQSDAMHQATLTMLTTTMASMAKAARDMMEAKPATPAAGAPMDPLAMMNASSAGARNIATRSNA